MNTDAELWNLLSGCLRVFLFSLTGQWMIIMICDRMLVRRRSALRLVACLCLKSFFSLILVGTVLNYYYQGELWVKFLGVFSSACTAILCYIPFVQTYYGGVIKILITENISEIMVSVIMSPSFILVCYMEGRKDIFAVYGNLQPGDILYYILILIIASVFCRLADPLLKRFRMYRIKNKKLTAALVIIIIGSLQIMGIGGVWDQMIILFLFYTLFLVYAMVMLAIFVLMYLQQRQRIRAENIFLNMQMHLMESHYASIQNGVKQMKKCQALIDDQMKEIAENRSLSGRKTEEYLEQLKKSYEEIRGGMYCDDWKVDAVLYCQSEIARAQGIEVECSLTEYDRGKIEEDKLVHILFRLFEYGIKANQEAAQMREKKIFLRMGGVLNQFVIEFCTTVDEKSRLSYRQLRKCIRGYSGELVTEKNQEQMKFVIILKKTDV